jgi:hypothetical protein
MAEDMLKNTIQRARGPKKKVLAAKIGREAMKTSNIKQ